MKMETLNEGRVGVAGNCIGIARAAYEAALRYARERIQFGKPIGAFQSIRFKIAEMATEIEAARQLVYNTIRLHVENEDCQTEVAMCKLFACEMANRVIDQAIQIFGGYGYMMEYPVQRAWRDARINTIGGGTSEIQREIIGRLLLR